MTVTYAEFERLVRDYVEGKVQWDAVHQYAIQMEYENKALFPPRSALQEIHTIFLVADENDDSQFRADRNEISTLLGKLEEDRKING